MGTEIIKVAIVEDDPEIRQLLSIIVDGCSKPGLGLAIASAVEERGADSIPLLLKRLFARLVGLARTQSG